MRSPLGLISELVGSTHPDIADDRYLVGVLLGHGNDDLRLDGALCKPRLDLALDFGERASGSLHLPCEGHGDGT